MSAWDFREPVSAWTHAAGFLLAFPALVILWRESRGGEVGRRASALIYGLSLMICYGASTLYHGVRVPTDELDRFLRLDRAGVFALIAGSYTPVAWTLMRGSLRAWTLAIVWSTAGLSILLLLTGRRFPMIFGTILYLALGWGVVVCYTRIARVVTHRALIPLVLGGISYSVGAIFNLIQWPKLWPGTFGTHDFFHILVIGGSVAHFWFITRVALPFERPVEARNEAVRGVEMVGNSTF